MNEVRWEKVFGDDVWSKKSDFEGEKRAVQGEKNDFKGKKRGRRTRLETKRKPAKRAKMDHRRECDSSACEERCQRWCDRENAAV